MKEDILEQIVEEYLQHRGYFTRPNEKFRPSQVHPDYDSDADRVNSDIDVIGIAPSRSGPERVVVVSCKSWQGGFDSAFWRQTLVSDPECIVAGKPVWKSFRELVKPKWADAFIKTVERITGIDLANGAELTYAIAVTKLHGDLDAETAAWKAVPAFDPRLSKHIQFLPLDLMLRDVLSGLGTTPASTQLGRLLQLVKAAGFEFTPVETKAKAALG